MTAVVVVHLIQAVVVLQRVDQQLGDQLVELDCHLNYLAVMLLDLDLHQM